MAKKAKKRSKKKSPSKPANVSVEKEGLLSRIKIPSLSFGKSSSLDMDEVKNVEDELRELINWVAVFEQEYDLPKEVTEKLLQRLHSVARKIGWLRCKSKE
ncbi:hypothetical protein HY837_04280 [archaeon]|nr:hypothetical protein [archaeon]